MYVQNRAIHLAPFASYVGRLGIYLGARVAYYCSKEHQKNHWRRHRQMCTGKKTDTKGPTNSVNFDNTVTSGEGEWCSQAPHEKEMIEANSGSIYINSDVSLISEKRSACAKTDCTEMRGSTNVDDSVNYMCKDLTTDACQQENVQVAKSADKCKVLNPQSQGNICDTCLADSRDTCTCNSTSTSNANNMPGAPNSYNSIQ